LRRENRRQNKGDKESLKTIFYVSGSLLGLAVIAFVITFVVYGTKLNNDAKNSKLDSEKIIGLVPNEEQNEDSEQASSSVGKTVEESEGNNSTNQVLQNTINNSTYTPKNETTSSNSQTNSNTVNQMTTSETQKPEQKTETKKKEITFSKPAEGEIIKAFAKDNLVYSDTLKEWVTHLGIDIQAEKTTVVKAAADGTVKAIKNDPRYGLTIVLEHQDGYTTVYSNLLTAEFVKEKEEVKQGQTIGTVGNTATFEILDPTHLHFEILKDNEQVDPTIYLK
jgi:peptidase M23B